MYRITSRVLPLYSIRYIYRYCRYIDEYGDIVGAQCNLIDYNICANRSFKQFYLFVNDLNLTGISIYIEFYLYSNIDLQKSINMILVVINI